MTAAFIFPRRTLLSKAFISSILPWTPASMRRAINFSSDSLLLGVAGVGIAGASGRSGIAGRLPVRFALTIVAFALPRGGFSEILLMGSISPSSALLTTKAIKSSLFVKAGNPPVDSAGEKKGAKNGPNTTGEKS